MDLDKIARLADITLTEEEKSKLEPQLSEVVKFFDQLNEVNTDGVEPTSQTTGLIDVTRPDEIDVTRILPQDGYFEVDALLDKDNI